MPDITIDRAVYRDKVLACWLGKNIGGTLGAPMEWKRQRNHVEFYTQELGGEPLPNDDLDIQLLWLAALERHGPGLDERTLAEWWCHGVCPHWAEYGIGKVNMRAGLPPPLSGDFRNLYAHSCGVFIRAEIWACVAPGLPAVAARYAAMDGALDHGHGEGTWAAVFTAAAESAAFCVGDARRVVEIGLTYLPPECGVARAIRRAVELADEGADLDTARDTILKFFRGSGAMLRERAVSPEDRAKGYHTGALGWDVPSNLAILVYGLLAGAGDFDRTICDTVNLGEDTDCTGATVGSLFGLLHGTAAIPERWIEPIGRGIKTICLNSGDCHWLLAKNVDELTERTVAMAERVLAHHGGARLADATHAPAADADHWLCPDPTALFPSPRGTVHRFDFHDVLVDYGDGPTIRAGEDKELGISLVNRDLQQALLELRWYLPEGWCITPGRHATIHALADRFGGTHAARFVLRAEELAPGCNRAVLEITSPGRPLCLLVPITLYNGNGLEALPVTEWR